MLANLVTLFVTISTATRCWGWHQDIARVMGRLAGRDLETAKLNLDAMRVVIAINASVFALGLYMLLTAHAMDVASSKAHPARVADFVVNGTVAFTGIWCLGAVATWRLRARVERIMALPALPLREVRRGGVPDLEREG